MGLAPLLWEVLISELGVVPVTDSWRTEVDAGNLKAFMNQEHSSVLGQSTSKGVTSCLDHVVWVLLMESGDFLNHIIFH